MHVVVVGDGDDAVRARGSSSSSYACVPPSVPTRRPRRSASERYCPASARADGEHLAELEVRDGDGELRAAGRACPRRRSCRCRNRRARTDASIDAHATWTNCGVRPSSLGDDRGDLDVEPAEDGRVGRDPPRRTGRRPPRRRPSAGRDAARPPATPATGPRRRPAPATPQRSARRRAPRAAGRPAGRRAGQSPRGVGSWDVGASAHHTLHLPEWTSGPSSCPNPGGASRTPGRGTSARGPSTSRPPACCWAGTSSASRPTRCCRGCTWRWPAGR